MLCSSRFSQAQTQNISSSYHYYDSAAARNLTSSLTEGDLLYTRFSNPSYRPAESRCSRPVFRTYSTIQSDNSLAKSEPRSEITSMADTKNKTEVLNRSDSSDGCCPICHENEHIYAVAPCNHHICYKCSTRLRLLLLQFDCPICRSDCAKVSKHDDDY